MGPVERAEQMPAEPGNEATRQRRRSTRTPHKAARPGSGYPNPEVRRPVSFHRWLAPAWPARTLDGGEDAFRLRQAKHGF